MTRKSIKKTKGITKGAPSGFVISLAIHAAAFLLAGLLVVFTVQKKEEKKFIPPKPVNRPKIRLKKPKVKVKKSAKPKATNRIVTKVKRASMPDIQLPEMSGMTDSFGGSIGGFEIMPDFTELTALGSGQSIGNDLVGVYYDLKFSRNGIYNPILEEEWRGFYHKFFREWNPRIFSKFYRAPQKLYSTCMVLPPSVSAMAPVAFGMDDSMASGGEWILHYKGSLVYKEDITFRFWVSVDDSLAIRVDNEVVLAGSLTDGKGHHRQADMFRGLWRSTSPDSQRYRMPNEATIGDWITLKAGEPQDIEIVVSDNPSTGAFFLLMVQVKGVEYPKGAHGGPLLPIFKTAKLSRDHLDIIYQALPDGIADFENGPIFRDY